MSDGVVLVRDKDELIIQIQGRFTFHIQKEFRTVVDNAVAEGPTTPLTIDMHRANYIDSAALGMLFLLKEQAGEARPLKIIHANETVLKILKAAYLNELFIIPQLGGS